MMSYEVMTSKNSWFKLCMVLFLFNPNDYSVSAKQSFILTHEEAVISDSIELNCNLKDASENLKWDHIPVGHVVTRGVTIGGQVTAKYHDRFSLKSTSSYNLVIRSVGRDDAGTYLCRDQLQVKEEATKTELIVLETPPICNSSYDTRKVAVGDNSCGVDSDTHSLSCYTTYFGNVPPGLKWKEFGDENQRSISDGYHVSNTINTKAKWNEFIYTCQSNSPKLACFVVIPKPMYAFNTTSDVTLHLPQLVTCLANSSQTCQYKWLKDGEISSTSPTLNLTSDSPTGEYRCLAECDLRGTSCVVQPKFVNYQYTPPSKCNCHNQLVMSIVITAVIAAIVIVVVLSISITFDIRKPAEKIRSLWRCKKSKKSLKREDSEQPCMGEENGGSGIILETGSVDLVKELCMEEPNKRIKGLTVLGNKIYIVKYNSSEISSFDQDTFDRLDPIPVADLKEPRDLVSCGKTHCLYVSDSVSCAVYKIYVNEMNTDRWSTGTKPEGLYVTRNAHCNVLVLCPKENKVKEFKQDGTLYREVQLNEKIIRPNHAILIKDKFLVCYGNKRDLDTDLENSVCMVSFNGKIILNQYNGIKISAESEELHMWPTRLSESRRGLILVLAYNYKQILLLDSNLNFVKVLVSSEDHHLNRMFLDEVNRRLYVTENEENGKIRIYIITNRDDTEL